MSSLHFLINGIERRYPKTASALAGHIGQEDFPDLIDKFLYEQRSKDHSSNSDSSSDSDSIPHYTITSPISVFHSAIATFYAPSDLSGIGGMHTEWIRSSPNWRKSYARHDTVLMEKDPDVRGIQGLHVARVFLFFAFKFDGVYYPCALVHWFHPVQDDVDEDTGMFMVEPEFLPRQKRSMSVVHLETIVRSAHLLPIFDKPLPDGLLFSDTLDLFNAFYVNKYSDHHAFEIIQCKYT